VKSIRFIAKYGWNRSHPFLAAGCAAQPAKLELLFRPEPEIGA